MQNEENLIDLKDDTYQVDDSVAKHYDASAESYHLQYERNLISDLSREYPANYFRLHQLINSFLENNIKHVVEIGVGEGTPLVTLAKAGMDVYGCDISRNMVEKTKLNFRKNNLDESRIIWADVQDPITYSPLLEGGRFEGLLAMGVMPHVRNEKFVLNNMKNIVKPGGKVFIEFRNKLFSMFTFNRYTYEFIMDDLLKNVSSKLKNHVSKDLLKRLEMDKPTPRLKGESGNLSDGFENEECIGYDAILSKFHNPFEIEKLFRDNQFTNIKLLWYHYHPAMPYLESEDNALFRDEGLKLEHEDSNWRGLFLCSAFVVEANTPNFQD